MIAMQDTFAMQHRSSDKLKNPLHYFTKLTFLPHSGKFSD